MKTSRRSSAALGHWDRVCAWRSPASIVLARETAQDRSTRIVDWPGEVDGGAPARAIDRAEVLFRVSYVFANVRADTPPGRASDRSSANRRAPNQMVRGSPHSRNQTRAAAIPGYVFASGRRPGALVLSVRFFCRLNGSWQRRMLKSLVNFITSCALKRSKPGGISAMAA